MKKLFYFLVAVSVTAGSYYVSRHFATPEEPEGGGPPKMPVTVEVAEAARVPMTERVTYPGSVLANETVTVASKVTGLIEAIHVEFGDYVEKGDLLIEIDDSEFVERKKQAEANLQLARAQLSRTETLYEHARLEFERIDRSGREGIASQQERDAALAERDTAKAQVEVAKAEVERMRAAVDEAELNVQNARLHSPLSGWVQSRSVDPGALATTGSEILSLVDTDPAEVVIYLPEREMALAKLGAPADVRLERGDLPFEGTITRVAPSLSMSTRTTRLIIDVPNEDRRLRPGNSVDVTLIAREDPAALAIPTTAIMFHDGLDQVYRVVDGVAQMVPIERGIETETMAEILDGLNEGDLVVTVGQFMLRDGQEVVESGKTAAAPPHTD